LIPLTETVAPPGDTQSAKGEASLAAEVIERLRDAQNRHDLDALIACFHPNYQSEQPAHPNRAFGGMEQVRTNWAAMFAGIPDFQAELLASAWVGDTGWAEWHWHGTHADGSPFAMRGVTLFGIDDDRIVWGRLYMETGGGSRRRHRRSRAGARSRRRPNPVALLLAPVAWPDFRPCYRRSDGAKWPLS